MGRVNSEAWFLEGAMRVRIYEYTQYCTYYLYNMPTCPVPYHAILNITQSSASSKSCHSIYQSFDDLERT